MNTKQERSIHDEELDAMRERYLRNRQPVIIQSPFTRAAIANRLPAKELAR